MAQPTSIRRLLIAGLLAAIGLGLFGRGEAGHGWSGSAWARLDAAMRSAPDSGGRDAEGGLAATPVERGPTIGLPPGGHAADGLTLRQGLERLGLPDALRSGWHPAPSDDSDSSDPSARPESRVGPSRAQPAGAVLAVSPISPRSRPFSSSTPRAPPATLHLA